MKQNGNVIYKSCKGMNIVNFASLAHFILQKTLR